MAEDTYWVVSSTDPDVLELWVNGEKILSITSA